MIEKLEKLFTATYTMTPDKIEPLRSDGSDRKIYRIFHGERTIIGIMGNNREENEAFINYSRHFRNHGLDVPEIYAVDLDEGVYLEEDLGDDTLFIWMMAIRDKSGFTDEIKDVYRSVVRILPQFQITAGKSIDYSYAYQHTEFALESMSWDLHYFKNHFLNYFYKQKIDHTELAKDFNALMKFLLQEKRAYFLYRDFQSRNIMIKDLRPYFIDYQSGRKGALQYDLGSLLYDAKANLPEDFRDELIDVYLEKARRIGNINSKKFRKYFYGFVLIRTMQAFGAYGYLSAVKGKTHFFKSVPYALRNLEILLKKDIPVLSRLKTLRKIFVNLTENEDIKKYANEI